MATIAALARRLSDRHARRDLAARVLFRTLGWAVNRERSMFLVGHRPDFDHDHGRLDTLARHRADWIRGNAANNLGDLARMYLIALNARQVLDEGIPGDFAELGVYKGNSAKVLAHYARLGRRTLCLFDTFSGFDPREAQGLSAEAASAFRDTSLDAVRAFVGTDRVVYVQGRFPDSLARAPRIDRYALVHVDCDLREPMSAALDHFYPRMAGGGMMILHDYASGHWPGVRRAVDEFLRDKPERVVLMPDKSGTAVLRKAPARPAG